ncbi:MAG TPA: T9SS type A sorting domain-containing protein, partial [Brumimicrobium sp.]|nr:T9SS type A sorting domain-containing protein [Brumimicrobium sp.]
STSHSTIVNDAYPDATFSNLSGPYCVNNAPITVSPNGPSGILGGNGVSSFDFDPSIAGLGTHKVYHTVTGTNTCTSSDTVSVVVTAAPVATFTGIASDYCIDDLSVITLSATQSGGDFTASGNGLSGNSFTPSVAGAGTHTITYDIELNGCTASASQAVNVNALPVLTFNALSDLCENDGVLNLSATPNGGTFSGPGISVSPTFDPSVAGEGTHTIEYEFTDANNCSASTVQSITVKPLPVATFTGLNSTYCADAASVPLTGTVPGGVFSGPGISGSPFTFNPTIAGANTHTITYTPPALNGCTNSSSQTVVVTPLSNALFSGLGVSYCADAASVTLTPSQTGGTFTGPGTTLGSSVFDPSVAGSGSHTITYTINDGNGCTATTSQPTVVSNVYPDATFSNLAGPYCVNNAPITVSPNGPIGILGGTGVTNFDFDPSIAGPGTHKVYHTVTGTNTCTSSDTVSVVVTAAPVATFTGIASNYCIDDLSVVTLSATESGGDFTASGNGLSGNSFTPSDAGVGTHTITYDIELNGCTASASQAVNVNALPILTFNTLSDLCKNNSALNLSATPNGGTFSGPGISASPTFDPSVAGEGTHTIEYEFTDANNCSANVSQSIVVNALPNVTLSGFDPTYCIDADSVVLEGLPIGGDFTVSGMTTNTFNPAIVGEGTHIVDYEYTDGNNCSVTVSENIVVHPLPNVNFTGLSNVVCENASALILTANLDGGTFNGPGMVDSIFNPSIAGAGTHTITYTAADGNGCSNSYSKMIQVNHDIDASFTGLNGSYCSADTSTIALIPNIPGGTFTGSGVSGNSWSPNDANVGNNTIVYEVSNVNCANSFNSVVNVLLSPNANFTALENVYCNNEAPINIVPNQSGGVLTATSGLSSSTFYPQIATIGTNIVTYSITSGNGCSNSSSDTLEVVSAPHSTITVEDTTLIADVVGGNITYQWINCNNQTPIVGENQQVSHVGKNGTYSVVVYDGMCRDTSDCVVVYFADLTAYLDENSINVYPNPNTGQFTVETKFDVKVEIINSIGKLVYKDEHFKGKNVVNLGSSIETGMYIVKFTDGNGNFGYKNIVVRN